MKYDILTILDTCADLVVDLGDVIPEFGQKEQYVNSFALDMGGSACIFACQCAKLGLKTAGLGVVGDDIFGDMVKKTLAESGVDTSNIITETDVQTGLGLHLKRKGDDRSILTYSGSIGAFGPKHIADELLQSARHLHIGSYYLLDKIREALPGILRKAKSFGLTTSLDTNWDPSEKWILPGEILSCTDIIFPNLSEALLLSGCFDLDGALKYFAGKVPVVAVKLGAGGGIAESGGERIKLPAPEVKVIDTIGAGDNFDAGFIYSYLHGAKLEKCLRSAIFCGSASAAKAGGVKSQLSLGDLPGFFS
ncbi:MAG: sugar kinase [Oscillospiraceae bacterium]|nr:sugar kinase [Oscillospiraceae bacterium]